MGHHRRRKPPPPRPNRRIFFLLSIPILLFLSLRLPSSVLRRANSLGRRCAPERPSFLPPNAPTSRRVRVAMVTFSFSTERGDGPSRRRSFVGLAELAGRNKREYAGRMGYGFVDAERLVDPRRPPSWSKIPAVRSCLGDYDWVFWNDAMWHEHDTNSKICDS